MIKKKIAQEIFSQIKKSKKILLALHVSPDADSVASVLAMDLFLERMGKKTKIISFSSLPQRLFYLPGIEKIEILDFRKINFSEFDLFIALDIAAERMITRSQFPKSFPKNFQIINIDHHLTNTKFGDINLVRYLSSTAEILLEIFKVWKIKIDNNLASLLFAGFFSDTGCFQYSNTTAETLVKAATLMKKGASLDENVLYGLRSYSLITLKYWGKVLNNMKLDKTGKFVWSKISRAEKEKLGIDPSEIEMAANNFAPIVKGTEFGIILVEEEENLIRGSLRARRDFDVAKIAVKLNGGGHKGAAGFTLAMSLKEAEKKVLEIARKYIYK